MLFDVAFLKQNKGFKYCFEAVLLHMYSEGCECVSVEYCLCSGVEVSSPVKQFKVYGT